jgi:AcrR family transcriptional regulator
MVVQKLNGHSKLVRKRIEILRSAATAFRDRGFTATSMRAIAMQIGLTPGALYHYFGSKSDLLYFCQEYSVDRMIEKARKALRLRAAWQMKLRVIISEQMLCMLDELNGSAAHIEYHGLTRVQRERIVRKRDAYEGLLRSVIERGIRAREFAPCDPKMVAFAILGAINWTARWYRPDGSQSPTEIATKFSNYLVRGLVR